MTDRKLHNSPECVHLFAEQAKVSDLLHEEDFILHFLLRHQMHQHDTTSAYRYYFEDGQNSAKKLYEVLKKYCSYNDTHIKICEFASGFGCVTRHFKNIIPRADITSIDIHPKATSFIEENLNTRALLSNTIPERISFGTDFDVLFALSFFSHIPSRYFFRWLNALYNCIHEQGYLLFTTHGESSLRCMPSFDIDHEGFKFYPNSEQDDLESSKYGTTVSLHNYVYNCIKQLDNVENMIFLPAFWWGHQNLYILKKGQL